MQLHSRKTLSSRILHGVPAVSLALCLFLSGCSNDTASSTKPAQIPQQVTVSDTPSSSNQTSPAPDRGAILYKKCRTCHTLGQGERHRVGPNLYGIFGTQAAQKEGFAYSKALTASEIVWTDEAMSAYIENPNKYVPGGRMAFAGIRKVEDRDALIAYLKDQTGETTAP